MKEIYLDNNATTKVDERVFEEMRPYFCELYGNPSSMHFFGGQVQKKVDEARGRVAALLGAQPDEIVFTACGTETTPRYARPSRCSLRSVTSSRAASSIPRS
jgi:cysteine desulfurase